MPRCRPFVRVVFLASVALLLAACGNKGPLVKPPPSPQAPTMVPVTPVQTTPAPESDGH